MHPDSEVPRDYSARRFGWRMGYEGLVNGMITRKMVKTRGGERPPPPPQPAIESWRLFISAVVSCPHSLYVCMWFPLFSVFLWACLRVFSFVFSFLLSFFLSFVFFPFLLSFFLSFYLSLSLSVSVCGAKEVDKGRVPGLGRKVVFAASTPTALSAVGAAGKVDVLAEGTRSDVAVDGFPVQLVSISKSFAALCISAATLLNVPSKD